MKKWKSMVLGAALAAVSIMPGFAFDMTKDVADFTPNLPVAVTLYVGMPESDFKANFSDMESKGWQLKVRASTGQYDPDRYYYNREEPTSVDKRMIQHERIAADISTSNNSVEGYGGGFIYGYNKGSRPTAKAIQQARDNAMSIYGHLYDGLAKIWGKPVRGISKPDDGIHGTFASASWNVNGQHADINITLFNPDEALSTDNRYIIANVSYFLY